MILKLGSEVTHSH